MKQLPRFAEAPFVISDSLFVSPRYRGFRVPAIDRGDYSHLRKTLYRKPIRVHDARQLAKAPTIEREGFELFQAPIDLDFRRHELVVNHFYDYCSKLVMTATGCLAARTIQHEFRTGKTSSSGAYAKMAHADICPLIEDVMEVPEGRHFGIFNVWRSVDPLREIETKPLALCDRTTVSAEDMVSVDGWRRTKPRTKVVYYYLIHNNVQCWFYFPRMRFDEAIVFRQYDSRKENPADRVTFHTAFEDPSTEEGAPLRTTIEARVLAVFAEHDPEPEARKARFQAEIPTRRSDGTETPWRFEGMVDWNNPRYLRIELDSE